MEGWAHLSPFSWFVWFIERTLPGLSNRVSPFELAVQNTKSWPKWIFTWTLLTITTKNGTSSGAFCASLLLPILYFLLQHWCHDLALWRWRFKNSKVLFYNRRSSEGSQWTNGLPKFISLCSDPLLVFLIMLFRGRLYMPCVAKLIVGEPGIREQRRESCKL